MTTFTMPGWRARLPIALSITSHYSPSGKTRGDGFSGCIGWGLGVCHIVGHEFLSLKPTCACVVSVYLCYSVVPLCVLVCCRGHWIRII